MFQSPNANSFNNQPTTPLFQNALSKPGFQNTSPFAANTLTSNAFGANKPANSPFATNLGNQNSGAIPLPGPSTNFFGAAVSSAAPNNAPFSSATSFGAQNTFGTQSTFGGQNTFGFGGQNTLQKLVVT